MSDLPKSDLFPIKNRAKGILPTVSVWGINPTNLDRVTDDEWDTPTGTGNTVAGAAGYVGQLDMDLGDVFNVNVRIKEGVWTTASSVDTFFEWSVDGLSYYRIGEINNLARNYAVAEYIVHAFTPFVRARYLRFRWYAGAAATVNVRIYEIQAIDLGV